MISIIFMVVIFSECKCTICTYDRNYLGNWGMLATVVG